jgi:DNA-binding protein HU-beta
MQIALVAIVLLAGMWFTVLKPKPEAAPGATAAQPTAPGATGLGHAVSAAKGAAATSDATNAKIQKATGAATPAATRASATKASATKATAVKTTKSVKAATPAKKAVKATPATDPSGALLRFLAKGKTVVLLFEGSGADDKAAREAVHRVARADTNVVSAYASISKVAAYRAITTDVQVTTAPTILVIGKNKKAVSLTGFVDYGVVRQAVGDVRVAAGQKR